MAEHVAVFHRRDIAVVEMQVRAADRRRGDANDRVARIFDFRIGNGVDAHVGAPVQAQRLHYVLRSWNDRVTCQPGIGWIVPANGVRLSKPALAGGQAYGRATLHAPLARPSPKTSPGRLSS